MNENLGANFKYTNKLINEASPYLQQHAHNPVNWYPWSDEALNLAKSLDRPILLSIGYSTCHWCHVMEKETFENEEIAPLFNDNFICIKVDREERPDLDHIYMTFLQHLTGQGGWPLNIFLTPDLEPFYGATYIPPRMRNYSPGIVEILEGVSDLYQNKKYELGNIKDSILSRVKARMEKINLNKEVLKEDIKDELYENLTLRYDKNYHGFSNSPKFPTPQNLLFLLNYKNKDNIDNNAYIMVKNTIESMYRGGIFDHVGGGISRYSVDKYWLVPHFEKMLYDNAYFMEVVAKANIRENTKMYKGIYYKILKFLDEELKGDILYYSALDADSEGIEGKFYVFNEDEINKILIDNNICKEDIEEFKEVYKVNKSGNFEGKTILNLINSKVKVIDNEEDKFDSIRKILLEYRNKRIRPHRDEKILLAWNSMLISALTYGYISFSDDSLLDKSRALMDTLIEEFYIENVLYTSKRDNILGPKATLDDYAQLIRALVNVYEITKEDNYLIYAVTFLDEVIGNFYNDKGGFTISNKNNKDLIINPIDGYDGALPSGNGVMLDNLGKIFNKTYHMKYKEIFDKTLEKFSYEINNLPEAFPTMINAVIDLEENKETTIITGPTKGVIEEKLKSLSIYETLKLNNTNKVFIYRDSKLRSMFSFIGNLDNSQNVVIYSCKNGSCNKPKVFEQS